MLLKYYYQSAVIYHWYTEYFRKRKVPTSLSSKNMFPLLILGHVSKQQSKFYIWFLKILQKKMFSVKRYACCNYTQCSSFINSFQASTFSFFLNLDICRYVSGIHNKDYLITANIPVKILNKTCNHMTDKNITFLEKFYMLRSIRI